MVTQCSSNPEQHVIFLKLIEPYSAQPAIFLGATPQAHWPALPRDLAPAANAWLLRPVVPLAEVAASMRASAVGRPSSLLRDQLESAGRQPGRSTACWPAAFAAYITTAYDTWLHTTLRDVGRQPTPSSRPAEVGFVEANRLPSFTSSASTTAPKLALTAADLRRLPDQGPALAGLVQPTLANKTVLISPGPARHLLSAALQASLFQAGTIRPSAFAVWQGLPAGEQTWLDQEVRVVEAPPSTCWLSCWGAPAGDGGPAARRAGPSTANPPPSPPFLLRPSATCSWPPSPSRTCAGWCSTRPTLPSGPCQRVRPERRPGHRSRQDDSPTAQAGLLLRCLKRSKRQSNQYDLFAPRLGL